jgi:hypothetical protein
VDGERNYCSNHVPQQGEILRPLFVDKSMDGRLNFLLDEEMVFEYEIGGTKRGRVGFRTEMSPGGEFYFKSGDARIYFGKWEGTFYLYRIEGNYSVIHRAFFLALPRIPLCYEEDISWEDFLPLSLSMRSLKKELLLLGASFFPDMGRVKGRYWFSSAGEIQGRIYSGDQEILTRVTLHPIKGFEEIEVREGREKIYYLRRV